MNSFQIKISNFGPNTTCFTNSDLEWKSVEVNGVSSFDMILKLIHRTPVEFSGPLAVNGCVHKGTNHVPKDASDRNPLRDWDNCDLNYVCSHALQMLSQSRTGSAHCGVIFCSYWLTHAWLQCAFPKCACTNHVPKELCIHNTSESGFLLEARSKTPFISQNAFQKPDLKGQVYP